MCGRYHVDDKVLAEIMKMVHDVIDINRQRIECYENKNTISDSVNFAKDVHPGDIAPVLISKDSKMQLRDLRWGYPGIINKGLIFNARAESVMDKKLFYRGINDNRAVIPARCFYEWNDYKEMSTFTRKDRKNLYFAGFYDDFNGVDEFIIITTNANESMVKIHDRMPLILEDSQVEDWIFDDKVTKDILNQIPIQLDRSSDYEQMSLF